jgi:hypothetical protein
MCLTRRLARVVCGASLELAFFDLPFRTRVKRVLRGATAIRLFVLPIKVIALT